MIHDPIKNPIIQFPENIFRPSWVQVDLDAISYNLRQIRSFLAGIKLLIVVKADAYGLGAVPVARHLEREGVGQLGVVTLDEAVELRRAGIAVAILNMGPILPQQAEKVLEYNFEQMVFQQSVAEAISKAAKKRGQIARLHLKIDTGMSRYGVPWRQALHTFAPMARLGHVDWVGAMTHFPMSDGLDKSFALLQIQRFRGIRQQFMDAGYTIPVWHMCNSGGALDLKEAHMDMVRVGLMVYGYYPSEDVQRPFELRPAMQVRTQIAALRTVYRGDTVGYGRRYMAEKEERIGVLPIGYGDGYDRKMRHGGEVLIDGGRAPIIGGLCMDACFVRLTDWPGVDVGHTVTLMGDDGAERITPHDIARCIDSVSYEVMARFGRRLPRIYIKNGKVVGVVNALLDRE
ncbi:alanine racemase [candidate division KSB1 bacterium]|nr:alanine racemase [candidate division KSB1 bacterium]